MNKTFSSKKEISKNVNAEAVRKVIRPFITDEDNVGNQKWTRSSRTTVIAAKASWMPEESIAR